MIKLFSLKQQKKDGESGTQQKSTKSAAQLRITKGKRFNKIQKIQQKKTKMSFVIFLNFFLQILTN